MENIIVACIAFVGTAVGTLGGIVASNKLTAFRLEQLEKVVREHNNFAHRMPVLEEQISNINHRIDTLEHE